MLGFPHNGIRLVYFYDTTYTFPCTYIAPFPIYFYTYNACYNSVCYRVDLALLLKLAQEEGCKFAKVCNLETILEMDYEKCIT